jgi:uncharacterized protein (DUF305 family)
MSSMDHTMHHAMITSQEQFIAEMIPHHQEAVDTSNIIIKESKNLALQKIAQAIVDGQSSEIAMLQGWMSAWYPSTAYQASYQNMMRPLDQLSGDALDQQYMQDMIKHHQ